MAFFGLTALGPQNSFQVCLMDFSYLDVFTAADIQKAFNIVDQERQGYLNTMQVGSFNVKKSEYSTGNCVTVST